MLSASTCSLNKTFKQALYRKKGRSFPYFFYIGAMKKKKIHHPHDSLFKKAFQDKEVATDFLKNRLPSSVLPHVDLTTLAIENTNYIAENLTASYSDLVLSVNIKGKKGYIYTLIELQTENDSTMALRLERYNLGIRENHLKQGRGKKLPTIINLVVYAGSKPYKGVERIIDAYEDPKLHLQSLHNTYLVNLNEQREDKILSDGKASVIVLTIFSGVAKDFKKVFQDGIFWGLLNKSKYSHEVVHYILDRSKRKPMEVLEEMDKLDAQLKQKIMSGLQRELQQREQQGIQLGKQQGILLGLQKGKQEGIEIGEQRGEQRGGISAVLDLVRLGHIDQPTADKILKDKFNV